MMDYASILADVRELVLDAGRPITLRTLAGAAADPAKPWRGPGTPTVAATCTTPAAFVPATGGGLGKALVREDLLTKCEQVALLAPPADGYDVEKAHELLDDGVRYRVAWVQALRPGPLTVLFAMGVAR